MAVHVDSPHTCPALQLSCHAMRQVGLSSGSLVVLDQRFGMVRTVRKVSCHVMSCHVM